LEKLVLNDIDYGPVQKENTIEITVRVENVQNSRLTSFE